VKNVSHRFSNRLREGREPKSPFKSFQLCQGENKFGRKKGLALVEGPLTGRSLRLREESGNRYRRGKGEA